MLTAYCIKMVLLKIKDYEVMFVCNMFFGDDLLLPYLFDCRPEREKVLVPENLVPRNLC